MDTATSPAVSPPRSQKRTRWLVIALQITVVLVVAAGFAALRWVVTLPDRLDDQQTVIIGATRFAPDSDASVRVVVQDYAAGQPIAGAHVQVSLQPARGRAIRLFEGQTDATGSLPVSFHVPADAPETATLVVETRSGTGRDRVEQQVTIQRDYRLLLTSDKPLYQPGQTIHMRVLALSVLDQAPARGATVSFLVEDAKGNKVYRRSVTTSDFGVGAADFVLADLVIQGNYKLSASIGETRSEKTVEVRPYVLPKFAVSISGDRSFYLPGQRVEGVVQADYFFGKPVALSEVQIVGTVWDVQRTAVLDLRGQTDENGTYAFSFDLPSYFAGSGLDSGQAQFALEVTVIDQAEHAEQTSKVLPIAAEPLIIEAVAESGVLKPGVENLVYVLTSYPDGRPASTSLQIYYGNGLLAELSTGEYGLAELSITPQGSDPARLRIVAQDESGQTAGRQIEFATERGGDSVLLRADRATYVVGETMHLVVLTPVDAGSIYLDIVKAGQTLSTRAVPVVGGRAEFAVDVSSDLYGTLELHAYKVLLDGTIVRDTRLVVVDAPNDLSIDINTDRDTYLPGDTAAIIFQTNGSSGAGVQSALGLAIVDESVFALQQQDAGFAKLYFLLEQQLLEPFYQIKQFEFPAVLPPDQVVLRQAQDQAAKASWAGIAAAMVRPVNSRPLKTSAVEQAQRDGLDRIGQLSSIGLILIPVALWAVTLGALIRAKVVKAAAVRLILITALLLLAAAPVVCMLSSPTRYSRGFYDLVEPLLLAFGICFAAGWLLLSAYAWVQRDQPTQFLSLLTLAWAASFGLLLLATNQGSQPPPGLLIAAMILFLLLPGAYLLFGQGWWMQQRRLAGATATGMGALSIIPVLLILTALVPGPAIGPIFGAVNNALDVMPMAAPAPMATQVVVERRMVVLEDGAEGALVPGDAEQPQSPTTPRLRQYFPETMLWLPEVLTDQSGYVSLDIPIADSITTWRLTALASSQDGRLGFTTRGIRVFQDFFVDVDLPVALTQGDEISIPIGVFNYLPQAQQVRLVVEQEPWFELLGSSVQTLTIASNDVDVVYFPIRVRQFGRQGFQVTAWGAQMSDAIRREVSVVPDGKEVRMTESNWLRQSREVPIEIPAEAVSGASSVEVKIYPGVLAQVVEGLEKILRLPHG